MSLECELTENILCATESECVPFAVILARFLVISPLFYASLRNSSIHFQIQIPFRTFTHSRLLFLPAFLLFIFIVKFYFMHAVVCGRVSIL